MEHEMSAVIIAKLFERAEPLMREIDHARAGHPVVLAKARWRSILNEHLGKVYMGAIRSLDEAALKSSTVRLAEREFLLSLGTGRNCSEAVQGLTRSILDLPVEPSRESAVARASYLTTVRLLAQLAEAESRRDLGQMGNEINVLDDNVIAALAWLLNCDRELQPSTVTAEQVEESMRADDWIGKAPALLLLKWAVATGYMAEHAAEIEANVWPDYRAYDPDEVYS
jgi:hypothetical protein